MNERNKGKEGNKEERKKMNERNEINDEGKRERRNE